jgi:hypothetical protein
MDVDEHALAVDIGAFQLRCFGSAETGGVQQQQDRSIADVGRGRNQRSHAPLVQSRLVWALSADE